MSFGENMTAHAQPWPDVRPVETRVPFAFIHVNKCGGSSIAIALGLKKSHLTAAQHRHRIGQDAWAEAFTFATVRNPFDRIASIYYYRVRTDQHGLADRHLNFNQWVGRTFGEQDPAYWDSSVFLAPAARWVCDDDRLIIDQIVKLEEIRTGWPAICRALGIAVDLKITNRNSHPPHGAIFNAASRQIVEKIFAEDLDRFGYSFQTD